MTAFVDFVEINQIVIGPLRPAPRRHKTLTGEGGHGRGDRDVGREVKIDLVFPVEARRRDRRVRQPIERDIVEHVIPRKVA